MTVARWNGRVWSDLQVGLPQGPSPANPSPYIAVLDDGSGPHLYAYAYYSNTPNPGFTFWIVRWNGTGWVSAPSDLFNLNSPTGGSAPWLSADLGSGPRIYGFTYLNQGTLSALTKWSGSGWEVLGGYANGSIQQGIVYNDGTGPGIYVVGGFSMIDGVQCRGIARWDGTNWSPLGTGLGFFIGDSSSNMCVYNDGTGSALYVGGAGTDAGGVAVRNLAKWDGHQWSDVGSGVSASPGSPEMVTALGTFDDGTGPGLYVAGSFRLAGSVPVRDIARWDGHTWSSLGAGVGYYDVAGFAVFDDGRGPSLFVGDVQRIGDGGITAGVAQWVGCPNCYANCDNSTQSPRLNVLDFLCFLTKFAARDPYANCNVDAAIDVSDFLCFLNKFAAGCP